MRLARWYGIMGKPHAYVLAALGILLAAAWFLIGRSPASEAGAEPGAESAVGTGLVGGPVAPVPHDRDAPESAVVREDLVFTPADVQIFHETMEWARAERLDTLPIGEIVAAVGQRFVGNPYTPHTLDLPGSERLVINLREFDCVTYVESVLALARLVRERRTDFEAFADELETIRYRDGDLAGYVSRLHYFSEWLEDNEDLGLVRIVTPELDGRIESERIDFMSTHADAYRPLDGNPDRIERIREIERRISARNRIYIPQGEVDEVVDGIRNGDIIAATSSVRGLDVAHTGFALWQDGALHLMHAPLVGKSLEISDQPLATRILGIDGQDGIMVARPL